MDASTLPTLSVAGSWLDWLIVAGLLLSVFVGAWRGLVIEVMALMGWVVAYVASQALGGEVSRQLPVGEPGSPVNVLAGMVVAFVLAWMVWALLSWLVGRAVRASVLSTPDRVLGAGFGCVRGLVVAMILCVVVSMTPLAKAAVWQSSQGVLWLQAGLLAIRPVLPPQVLSYLPA